MSWKKIINFFIVSFVIYLSCSYLIQISGELSFEKIMKSISYLNVKYVCYAFLLTFLNYIIVIFYDVSVSGQLRLKISLKHLSLISVITFILNNNLGLGAFLGGALRFRFLSRLNIDVKDIGKYLVIFAWVYWVGLIFLAAVTFIFLSPDASVVLPFTNIIIKGHWIGLTSLFGLSGFIAVSVVKDFFKLKWRVLFPVASTKRLIIITIISTLDWVLLSFVFYFLLPSGKITYINFLPKFLIAQIGAVTSHVPAGLGIFDSIMLYYFKDIFGVNSLVSSLLIFRVIYFIIPMVFGVSLFGLYEMYWNNKLKLRKGKL